MKSITIERIETLLVHALLAAEGFAKILAEIKTGEIDLEEAGETIDEIVGNLTAAHDRSTCAACDAVSDGPVPAYCSEHDGDYSSFLAMHNCD